MTIDPQRLPQSVEDLMERKTVAITQSAISLFMTCPQRYAFRYLYHLAPSRLRIPLIIGSAFHKAMETLLQSKDMTHTGVANAQKAADEIFDNAVEQSDQVLPAELDKMEVGRAQVHAMTKAWFIIDGDAFEEHLTLEIELKVHALETSKVGDSLDDRASGIIDGLIAHKDEPDKVWILEHKTKASIADINVESLQLDTQALWYALLAMAVEADVLPAPKRIAGLMYNAVQKPQHRMSARGFDDLVNRMTDAMISDPDKYFRRDPIIIERGTIERARKNFERVIDKMDNLEPEDIFMATGISHISPCSALGGCEYRALCREGVDAGDPPSVCQACALSMYTTREPHEELNDGA